MPYNFVADNFHTKKLCSIVSWSEVRFWTKKWPFFFFWAPFVALVGHRVNVRWSS